MISPLPGWTFDAGADAILLRLCARPDAGIIRYVERRRPCLTFPEIVAEHVQDPAARVTRMERREDLVTNEGEYGALVRMDGAVRGRRAQHILACIFVDDFYAELLAVVVDGAERERFETAVRTLARGDCHMMTHRRRRYLHTPPAGWRPTARGSALNAVYLPPDPQTDPSALVVAAAVPVSPWDASPVDAILSTHVSGAGGVTVLGRRGQRLARTRPGLWGRVWELDIDNPRFVARRFVAILQDDRHTYSLHLDSALARVDSNRDCFHQVVGSVTPLPCPGRPAARAATAQPFLGLFN
jgi:hypothetical protein